MLFNSIDFLLFFPIVLIGFWSFPARLRKLWLFLCSYFFYMCWNAKYIVLILGTTIVTYACAILMEKTTKRSVAKLLMIFCIALNLGNLFFFKYFNFTMDTISRISGSVPRHYEIILPVGISFFTFQALGYVIDCYRGETKAEHNFVTYALFVSFFPQLVAGPIERSKNLLGQIRSLNARCRKELIDWKEVRDGLIMIAWGMFIKLVIADRVAIIVNNAYKNYETYGSVPLLMAFFGFGLQIYCDFSSYSIIAIGAARVMGVKLMENFNAPYFATSITDFWRKWHISLSTWFRDYVYIPLGGNRKGKARKLMNVLIVFTLSGLWHGANWTFVFWGMIHGVIQIFENLLKPSLNRLEKRLKIKKKSFGFNVVRAICVTLVVDFAWIFFRADNFEQAYGFIKGMFIRRNWWVLFSDDIYKYGLDVQEMWILAGAIAILMLADYVKARKKLTIDEWLSGQFMIFRVAFVLLLVTATVMFGEYGPGFDSQQFLYFQF